jgi:3-hydroxyacyl-[acyl-carrier-protein] dehydratase
MSGQRGQLISLDRVCEIEAGARARAIRNVPNTLAILDTHFPRKPVLPGVLILGSMGQLASLLLEETTGRPWRLAGATRVRYRHFVQPGDSMELVVELAQHDEREAVCRATASVDGRTVTTASKLRLAPAAAPEVSA